MQYKDKYKEIYPLIRSLLKRLGLTVDSIDEIISRIGDFVADKVQNPLEPPEFPYVVRDDFLTPVEQNFYQALKPLVPSGVLVCPKVALGDLFAARPGDAVKSRLYANKLDRKHVDFLLCDARTARPIAGIQLEDPSRPANQPQARDPFIENVFRAARLPLVSVLAKNSYSAMELNSLLQPYLQTATPTATPPAQSPAPEPRTAYPQKGLRCPKCGSEMVLRTAISGDNQVDQFWGCSRYPQCRGVLKYDPRND